MNLLLRHFFHNSFAIRTRYIQKIIPLKNIFKDSHQEKCFCVRALDINTNVVKDVILYKFSKETFFKAMNFFAICQFGFWSYLSVFAFTNLRDAPVDKTKENQWYEKVNLGENKYRYGLSIFSFIIGFGILALTWMYMLRSVKYLILRKGGKEVTIMTYVPFGQGRMFTLGLENINCKEARQATRSQLPIKVKGHLFHYIIDMKGEFKNATLFDHTVGLRRTWKR